MPKLVSMKLSKAAKKERNTYKPGKEPDYPNSLCITLDSDALEKLGMDTSDFKVGGYADLVAYVCVKSIRKSEGTNYDSSSVELQIERLGLEKRSRSMSDAVSDGIKQASG